MTAPIDPPPIGDREVDRLLALVPPPPFPPTGLTDRIVARATAVPQVPPLPPRRAPRSGRRRIGRGAWAGAVLGSFLLTIAAAAAVLGGHVDLHRLAALPAALFGRHATHAPARSENAPAPARPGRATTPARPASAIPIAPPIVAEPAPAPPAMRGPVPVGRPAERLLHRPALPRPLDRRPAVLRHAPPRVREPLVHPHPEGVHQRREPRGNEGLSRLPPGDKALRPAVKEDDAASANRESLRAAQRSTERNAGSAAARDGGIADRAGTGAAGYDGQRWNGQRRPGWRRRGFDRFGGWRSAADEAPRPAGEAGTGGTSRPAEERAAPKAPGERGARGGGGRRGKARGRRR